MALSDTKSIVPRGDQEGTLGTAAKSWGQLFINNPASQSAPGITLDHSTVDQIAVDINANNIDANVLDIAATALTTSKAINVDVDAITTGYAAFFDIADSATGDIDKRTGYVGITRVKSGVTGDGNSNAATGLQISMTDSATNHANATVQQAGLEITVDSASNQGTITNIGIDLEAVTDGDTATTYGLRTKVEDGGYDLMLLSSADANDYLAVQVGANGATTLTTVDGGAGAAHLTVTVDGHMVLGAGSAAELNILNGQAQYDSVWNTNGGREMARFHNGDTTQSDADIVAVTHGFGWKHPVFKIDATSGDKTATLVAEQSGAIFHCLAAANNITINLPAADSRNVGMWFIFTAFEAVSGSKTIVINTNGTDGNDKFMMFGFNAATSIADIAGDTLTFPNSTVIGTTVKVTCISPGAEDAAEIWLAEVHGSPAITNA